MKIRGSGPLSLFCSALLWSLIVQSPCFGVSKPTRLSSGDKFFALPLGKADESAPKSVNKYGIPFLEETLQREADGSARVAVDGRAKRIFLLGMTESDRPHVWNDPRDLSLRYFVGDKVGQISVDYADGSTEVFPLILGESIWWGKAFFGSHEPFSIDAHLQKTFSDSMRIYPAAPVEDGNYVAVIVPRAKPIRSIEIENARTKKGSVVISGITVESAANEEISGATAVSDPDPSPDFSKIAGKPLRPSGMDEKGAQERLDAFRRAYYESNAGFKGPISTEIPQGYSGPEVSFQGNLDASVLQNAFYANVQDMLAKVDPDGMYHTSTRGALWWKGDFGTYHTNLGVYYGDSWSRDMGRTLQELTELGYLHQSEATADYSFRMARLWSERSLKFEGVPIPPHWSRIINKPNPNAAGPFENDGHGLISLYLYKLWQRVPDRDAWLRAHWTDVKAAGDWIPWEFDHPEISGAANGVLLTTSESAGGKGYSVYPDYICMTALEGLAQMADSIGETQSATLWRDRAEKMRAAIPARYLTQDTEYGQVWTLDYAGWPVRSTVLGPLIFQADYQGFAPEDGDPKLKAANEAAYQRLIDTYRPFGFYGQAMGYGTGFVTQAALLLDRMHDLTPMLDWAAKEIYDPRSGSFIVPEGVTIDPTGQFWYPTGDLGNGVQEAEIIKTLRIVIGVDDTQPQRLQIFPRMPYGWNEMAVDKYPALVEHLGKTENAFIHFNLKRDAGRMSLEISSDKQLGPVAIRLGPFEKKPDADDVRINGQNPATPSIEYSGDSWWVRSVVPIGPVSNAGMGQ